MARFLAPMTEGLLRVAARGLGLSPGDAVLDLCCGSGAASLLLAADFGVHLTGVDSAPAMLREARAQAGRLHLEDRVRFFEMDARHLEFPPHSFHAILALGGTPTYIGRIATFERVQELLLPGGWVLFSDLVYLDSPPPKGVPALLEEVPGEDGMPLRPAENRPGSLVRVIFEEGRYSFETEESYLALLEASGLSVEFHCLVPEGGWAEYYGHVAAEAARPGSYWSDPANRQALAQELAAFYSLGGRQSVGYLLAGARPAGHPS